MCIGADSLDLRKKRGELVKERDDKAKGSRLSCREVSKDLARNVIGQGYEAASKVESDERW